MSSALARPPSLPVQGDEITAAPLADIEKNDDDKIVDESHILMRSPYEDFGVLKSIKIFKKAVFIGFLAGFATAFDGYQISITGSIIANKGFIKQFGTAHNAKGVWILDANVVAIWGGIGSLGQGLGMLLTHFMADGFGRKKAFYLIWVVLLASVCCESFGRTWQVWLIAKLTSGYAVGSIQFMNGMYMAEISPTRIRGFLVTACFIWYCFGQLFASIALKVLSDNNPLNYLDAVYTEWAMVGALALIYAYIPESPIWCASRGRHDQGRAIINRLFGSVPGYDVDYHYEIIKVAIEEENTRAKVDSHAKRTIWTHIYELRDIFVGSNGLRFLIAFMPSAVQQLGGLAVLSSYSSYFAQVAGFADPFLYSLLLALAALLIVVISAFITDKTGRRTLFLTYITVTWCMGWIIGGMGLIKNPTHATNSLVLFFSLIWRMSSTAIGTLHWSYAAETANSRLRAKTAGIASAGGVIIGIVFSTSVPYMLNQNYANWGLKTCFFFAGISTPVIVASYFLMPDTSNRTPAELNEMFEKGVKPWRFRSYVTDAQKALAERRRVTGESDPSKLQW